MDWLALEIDFNQTTVMFLALFLIVPNPALILSFHPQTDRSGF
jgi:hypothetical protein